MNSLGRVPVFAFVSKEAVNKTEILSNLLNGENRTHYITIQSMVKYELDNGLVDLTKRENLLRLHRALRFLELFFERLRTSSEDSKTSVMCSEAYNESLAQYHASIIRKANANAFCALPGRPIFFEVMNVGTPEEVVAMLGEALPIISDVYNITENVYAQHELLQLP